MSRESILGRAGGVAAAALGGALRVPRWLLATVFRTLRDGYTIAVFEGCAEAGERVT